MSSSISPKPLGEPGDCPRDRQFEVDVLEPLPARNVGCLRKLWLASRRLDVLWYQLQKPDIAVVQQFVNCALRDVEQVQILATVVVTAERTLRVLDALRRIECTLRHWRRTWKIPGGEFPLVVSGGQQVRALSRILAKLQRLANIICLLIAEIFQLAMFVLDIRESLTWNEQNRRERVGHMIVDIARLCEHAVLMRESLRGEQERVDWWLKRLGSPLRAERLYCILGQIDRFGQSRQTGACARAATRF